MREFVKSPENRGSLEDGFFTLNFFKPYMEFDNECD